MLSGTAPPARLSTNARNQFNRQPAADSSLPEKRWVRVGSKTRRFLDGNNDQIALPDIGAEKYLCYCEWDTGVEAEVDRAELSRLDVGHVYCAMKQKSVNRIRLWTHYFFSSVSSEIDTGTL